MRRNTKIAVGCSARAIATANSSGTTATSSPSTIRTVERLADGLAE
ncbi:MAG: hypothetical protein F2817_07830 [Actinobacteria bacterium]|nr:hypothetical protein [Actinomycetota bacterium]